MVLIGKMSLVILTLMAIQTLAQAQVKVDHEFGHRFIFDLMAIDSPSMIRERVYSYADDTAIYRIFSKLTKPGTQPVSPILLGVKINPTLMHYFSAAVLVTNKSYQSFIISDSSEAVLVAMGIDSSNYTSYKYHVIEDDSRELIPWSPVQPGHGYGARKPFGLIGKFRSPGKQLMIEVARNDDYNVREGVIFDWRVDYKPRLQQVVVSMPHAYFNLAVRRINHGFATRFDNEGLPLDLHFPADSIGGLSFTFNNPLSITYGAFLLKNVNGHRDTSRIGFIDQLGSFYCSGKYINEPGDYEFRFGRMSRYPDYNDRQMLTIPFTVLPRPWLGRRWPTGQIIGYAAAGLALIICVFLVYRSYSRARLVRAELQRETALMKLRAVRAQLDPHFMSNALSSIQNLVNKHDELAANHYLSRIAALTRKVLTSSDRDLITLEDELKITDDYLQMEQLRFGFEYELRKDDRLDAAGIEVPSLLLQPLVENAVKHGVAGLKKLGRIIIKVEGDTQRLFLTITDNGPGFNPAQSDKNGQGYGLKLSKERIDLLNDTIKGRPLTLQIDSNERGTTVILTMNNWL